MEQKNVLPVSKSVHWAGVLDPDLVTFDIVMETEFGTSYNSYFIDAEKKTLVDTVKADFKNTFINKLKSLTDPSEIEYIICNHTEPDHSGSLPGILELAPGATVVGSTRALNYLQEMLGKPFKSMKVKDGNSLDLGDKTLRFISAPNLHWPDTIYTYLEDEQVLFTCDSFGAHYCDERMYDDLVGDFSDAFEYYFKVILRPFSKFMLKAIEKIKPLDIKLIAPGHGPILRSKWKEIVDRSESLARYYLDHTGERKNRILICYVSAYGYTGVMAENIAKGIKRAGDFAIDMVDIEHMQPGELEEKMARCDALLVGSPTINQNTLLPVYRLFSVINPIRDRGKPAAGFGSYGWSGEPDPGTIEKPQI